MKGRPRMLSKRRESTLPYVFTAVVFVLVILLLVLDVVRSRFTFLVPVSGNSMQDTVFDGDVLYALYADEASRGDIVIIDTSDNDLFEADAVIKRLIAVEGERVKCENGVVYVCGADGGYEPLSEPYAKGVTYDFPEVEVGAGEIFFMGDNREHSYDAREAGTVSKECILGVVPEWAVSIRWFSTPLETFRLRVGSWFDNLFQ